VEIHKSYIMVLRCGAVAIALLVASLSPYAEGFVCATRVGSVVVGYDDIVETHRSVQIANSPFDVTAKCTSGYKGTVVVTPCTADGEDYTLSGCAKMTCDLQVDVGEIMPSLFRSTERKGKPRVNTGTAGRIDSGTTGGGDDSDTSECALPQECTFGQIENAPHQSTLVYTCDEHGFHGTAILTCGKNNKFENTQHCECSGVEWGSTSCLVPWVIIFLTIIGLGCCGGIGFCVFMKMATKDEVETSDR
jgi:hypothetical protein